jgi:hypothetical protein
MITYQILINNIFHSSIQANSRSEAVNMANDLYEKCAGIHVSKPSQWGER